MNELASIRQVADHFAVPVSTLHYWERRGLITASRRSGHRYYDRDQVYRIALIQRWRGTGRLPIDEIATALATEDWREIVTARIAAIESDVAQLNTARAYLRSLLECPHGNSLDHCAAFRATVALPVPE
ncbi:helix-turn-helix domain-containing protein [Nocardia pseudobrasiliensis]|uniref:DNA-binding transcriptional MerR regulator n=1 Tax=Nocardia pseudobrasiliensis TaxID=45979 RepID=A0A370HZF7_9NOCA|nr:MerR family transcriptional regulator [Nocardia pseudobrasiliensis]RDI63887.1 DNA-binding transcriptional MerR regulator [Nocardia pseudobrasiliensis]